jgi:hypothetical protein
MKSELNSRCRGRETAGAERAPAPAGSEQAFATHETELTWINYDPLLMRMANEPRFKRLLLKMKLPN